jgi:hypothetical protein
MFAAGPQQDKRTPERVCGYLRFFGIVLGIRINRVDKVRETRGVGHDFVQNLEPFPDQLVGEIGESGCVAARPVQTGDDPLCDRVLAHGEYNGYRRGSRLGRPGCRWAACNQHGHSTANQVSRQGRKAFRFVGRIALLDRDVAAVDVTDLAQAFAERRQKGR